MSREGVKVGNRVQMAMNMMEIDLWDMNSKNQLNFITEYMKYIGLGSWGQSLICTK